MKILYTIGHSNHSLENFLEILFSHRINHIVDVRTLPQSRHVPWFNKNAFNSVLLKNKIEYTHLPKLGGLRHTMENSVNIGWKNKSFRGFADYMQTNEFLEGLDELNHLLMQDKNVAIMCAEALPWKCHRSLIADAELARKIIVMDIFNRTNIREHKMTSFAVIYKTKKTIKIYYPKDSNKKSK